ncbi:trypsin-like peptidase domain-containing protein [Streptomyces sp. NBC_00076]|uniref:trypsin-like peptidase domain-containing protein n=1 Tax=Streptomyces sp. NBC_00076 TaxID=2975642 RepID=UPI00386EBC4E
MAGLSPPAGDADDTARPPGPDDTALPPRPADGSQDARGGCDEALVRIHDPAGRPRGTGFLADHHGMVVTSHETVDGLPRLALHAPGDRRCVVTADAVTPLPELGLALVRTEGLGVAPLPVTVRDRVETGAYVRIPAGCWREARVLGAAGVTYAATDRSHLLDGVLELAIGTAGRDALRPGGGASGGPVLDAGTGAVIGVLGTALRSGHRDAGFAVPLRPAPDGPLAALLAENASTVPAYGADLNLAGVLELTVTSVAQDGPQRVAEAVERAATAAEFAAFAQGPTTVLGLVGDPGSGRTTELAALADRRHRCAEPAPTLWLRGADLEDGDHSVEDAARRALTRAARIVAAARSALATDLGDLTPDRLARLSHTAGRPLLLLLDGPEDMPRVLARRLPEWTAGTATWLRQTGARLVMACRGEYWEEAGAGFPAEMLYDPRDGMGRRGRRGDGGDRDGEGGTSPRGGMGRSGGGGEATLRLLPPGVHLGDLREDEARQARARYRVPDNALADPDARHPLTLRLLSEIHAALPDAPQAHPHVDRDDVFSAYLDLMCLRVAVRLAAARGLRGSAVRRLAAKVSGQVHEAARRSLGSRRGELDRESFEAVFPWGQAPARLGGGTGWASAVLTEGLLVPAGTGYRFAHEELADWLQGTHLDLDEALRALVHSRRSDPPGTAPAAPVPHHRIGPVIQALLLLARQHGVPQLSRRLEELTHALDADPFSWWAARLLAEVLRRVPDATPYTPVLRLLTDRIVSRQQQGRPLPAELGPDFWIALPLPQDTRLDLLRRLVLADGPPHGGGPRFLDAVARLLTADPTVVQTHLIGWFDDERPLPATPHATVAEAAQALLHTHRHHALDDLTELLVACAHGRADELLAVLAEDEPSAVCRAVDRWARDGWPARRVAAVAYGLRVAPHVRTAADRELLRHAALALLARSDDRTAHGGALTLLLRDPRTRAHHLPQALRHFVAGDPNLPPGALVPALATHPEPVLDAFRARLGRPDAGEALRALADATTPALARRVVALAREAVERRPETAVHLAGHVDRRLDQGPTARAVLRPLVAGLLDGGPEQLRAALAGVLAASGTPDSRPLRQELLELLLTHEHDPSVLLAVVRAAAFRDDDPVVARGLVHRTGLLLLRTPQGATCFDRSLVDLGRQVPGFAALLAGWLTDAPQEWAAVVGPSARRTIEHLADVPVSA